MLLASLGCEVLVHDELHRTGSCVEHARKGWYVGTSTEYYKCQIIVMKDIKGRVSDTVFFSHKFITQPDVTTYNRIMAALKDLAVTVQEEQNGNKKTKYARIAEVGQGFKWQNKTCYLNRKTYSAMETTIGGNNQRFTKSEHWMPRVKERKEKYKITKSLQGTVIVYHWKTPMTKNDDCCIC